MRTALFLFLVAVAVAITGCPKPKAKVKSAPSSIHATDGRLEISAAFAPGVKKDRVPTRTIELTFKNVSSAPLRMFLPTTERYRANISTIFLSVDGGELLEIPEPNAHGYVVTERDFFLLEPGEERLVRQTFTLDPVQPGGGSATRRPGFETGRTVDVRWIYENAEDIWGGSTKPLFGGRAVPHIWKGNVVATGSWTIADD